MTMSIQKTKTVNGDRVHNGAVVRVSRSPVKVLAPHEFPSLLVLFKNLTTAIYAHTPMAWEKFRFNLNLRLFSAAIKKVTGLSIKPNSYQAVVNDYTLNWDTNSQSVHISTICDKCQTLFESNPVKSKRDLGTFLLELNNYDCKNIIREKISKVFDDELYNNNKINDVFYDKHKTTNPIVKKTSIEGLLAVIGEEFERSTKFSIFRANYLKNQKA